MIEIQPALSLGAEEGSLQPSPQRGLAPAPGVSEVVVEAKYKQTLPTKWHARMLRRKRSTGSHIVQVVEPRCGKEE